MRVCVLGGGARGVVPVIGERSSDVTKTNIICINCLFTDFCELVYILFDHQFIFFILVWLRVALCDVGYCAG